MSKQEGGLHSDWPREGELVVERIYVGDLDPGIIGDAALAQFFSQFGKVTHSVVIGDRGYGFVTFEDVSVVKRLLERREPLVLAGRRLCIRQARRRKPNVPLGWGEWEANTRTSQGEDQTDGKNIEGMAEGPVQGVLESHQLMHQPGDLQLPQEPIYEGPVAPPLFPVPLPTFPHYYLGPDGFWYSLPSALSCCPAPLPTQPYPSPMIAPQENLFPSDCVYVQAPSPGALCFTDQGFVVPDCNGNYIYPIYNYGGMSNCSYAPLTYVGPYFAPTGPSLETSHVQPTAQPEIKEIEDPEEGPDPVASTPRQEETLGDCGVREGAADQSEAADRGAKNFGAKAGGTPKQDVEQQQRIFNQKFLPRPQGMNFSRGRHLQQYHEYHGPRHFPGQGSQGRWGCNNSWGDYRHQGNRKFNYRMDHFGNWVGGGNGGYYGKNYIKKKRVFKEKYADEVKESKEGIKEQTGPQPDLLQGPMEKLEV